MVLCGVDEAGRGALAGPVVAAAVVLKDFVPGLSDSKKLRPKVREKIFSDILKSSIFGVGICESFYIDLWNIKKATLFAMVCAVNSLGINPDFVIVDGIDPIPINIPQKSFVKGDAIYPQIQAASIVAKVVRDSIMEAYDPIFPDYGFSIHKGYGTKSHFLAIKKYGFSPIHRKSFKLSGWNI